MSCVFDARLGLQMNQIAAKKPEADTELDDQEMDSSLDRTPPGIQVIQADKYDSEPQKLAVADDDSGEGGGELSDYPNTDYCENEEDSDEDESINLDAANYGFDPLDKYLLRKNKSSSPPNGTAKPIDMDYGNTKPEPRDATDRLIVRPKQEVWERRRGRILMEGFVEEPISNELDPFSEGTDSPKCFSRTKSLTDEDLDELKGCLDLGFGFNYEEIPELCNTLPALELCYSISQRFQDEQQRTPSSTTDTGMSSSPVDACSNSASSCSQSPIANWKISSPGDCPEQVKARLKFWAQAVACTVRLCS